ncbi:RluA family pseudouridine synthase [Helicovermis profundi]|uniref:Pseudouridine synthase n=1 Tax=Helicovermis profundi TaxID=3065157 RepID=A0AAU9ELD8_9FIRM|nr:RluA family pseudouridine synthase [Clostridia bacterium S502]
MREIIIGTNENGQRLDRFLTKYLNNSSRSNIYKLIRKKVFKVNGKRIKEEYFLKEGDVLEIFLAEESLEKLIKEEEFISASTLDLDIVFEDEDILIVNKPKGLLTHPDKSEYKNTLSTKVNTYLKHLCTRTFKPASIQRLDKNTSGLIIFCKNYESLKNFNEIMRERKIKKFYLAVVEGIIKESGEVKGYIEKDSDKNKVYMSKNKRSEEAKLCHTKYKPLKIINNNYTLLEVELLTGRTHQIRVSMSYIKHPIVGDKKYTGKKLKNVNSQLLHGYKVIIDDEIFINTHSTNEFTCVSKEIELFLKN